MRQCPIENSKISSQTHPKVGVDVHQPIEWVPLRVPFRTLCITPAVHIGFRGSLHFYKVDGPNLFCSDAQGIDVITQEDDALQ